MGITLAATSVIPSHVIAAIAPFLTSRRSLSFYNIYTDEYVNEVYWEDGRYRTEGLERINYIMRDVRYGKERPIDVQLLDLLYAVRRKLRCDAPFDLVSGYRTPWHNAMLARRNRGAARNSLHMYGKAVDINLPGCSLEDVRRAATELRIGGVGYYPSSKFVHVDVGRVRYWRG
jgi:uncharacterized protein YcbK (DUF882 family)